MPSLTIPEGSSLEQVLHAAIDDLCGRRAEYVPEKNVVVVSDAVDSAIALVRACARGGKSKAELHAAGSEFGLGGEQLTTLATVVEARAPEIEEMQREHASGVSTSKLEDIDWKVHLTMGSDVLASHQEARALVQFTGSSSRGQDDALVVDLSKADLDKLIATCSAAEAALGKMGL